jgi:putative endonuclease
MSHWVYILQSEIDGSYYVGSTQDVSARLERHNRGGSRYTKTKIPWKLVYQERARDRSEAVRREKQIKGRKSRTFIEGLVRASRQT